MGFVSTTVVIQNITEFYTTFCNLLHFAYSHNIKDEIKYYRNMQNTHNITELSIFQYISEEKKCKKVGFLLPSLLTYLCFWDDLWTLYV